MSRAKLFTPLRLGAFELANRIVIAPMCQYSAEKGCMTDWHVIHLGHLALSGAALLTIEATAVVPEGRITYSDVATTLHTAIAESKTPFQGAAYGVLNLPLFSRSLAPAVQPRANLSRLARKQLRCQNRTGAYL